MSLTAKDKAVIKDFWGKIANQADAIGQEAMGRYEIYFNSAFLLQKPFACG